MKKTLLAGAALAAAVTMTRAYEPPEGVTWSRGQPPPASGQRFASFTGGSYDEATRTCDAVFATGAEVRRWYGTEKLEISEEAIDLSRVALNQVRLLFSHDSKQPIGVVLTATIEGGALAGKVQFADTDEGRKYAGMVQRSELTGISVGYNVTQWTRVEDLEKNFDEWTATRWELMEVSLVAVPADPLAGVRSAEPTPGAPPIADPGAGQRSNEEEDMLTIAQVLALSAQARSLGLTDDEANAILSRAGIEYAKAMEEILAAAATRAATTGAASVSAVAALAAQAADIRAAAPVATAANVAPVVEAARTITIAEGLALRSQAVDLNVDGAVVDEILQRSGITREQAAAAVMEAAANANRSAVSVVPAGAAARVTVDATETQRELMIEALAARMASTNPTVDGARQYMGGHVMSLWAERAGINERDPTKIYDIVSRRDGGISVRAGAMMTSSDFPLLLEAAANKTLQAAYNLQTPSYRAWAKKRTFKDFKAHNFYRVGEFPKLLPLGEAGEIKAGTFKESKESAKLATSARLVMMTRAMLVNDDLNAFGDFSLGAGRAVSRRENEVAYAFLLQNGGAGPKMADGKNMFHADHLNLAATGAIPTEVSLDEARQLAYGQKDLDGNELNVDFPILLYGPKNSLIVDKLLVDITPTKTDDVNVFAGKRRKATDAKITNQAWYNLGDPALGESNFLYGYLGDREGPMLREDKPFNYDGMGFGLIHDFGFGADDHRFGVYNPGP